MPLNGTLYDELLSVPQANLLGPLLFNLFMNDPSRKAISVIYFYESAVRVSHTI